MMKMITTVLSSTSTNKKLLVEELICNSKINNLNRKIGGNNNE